MAMKYCPECGKEISTLAPTCPHCGAPQYDYNNSDSGYRKTNTNQVPTNKILAIVALSLSILGILLRGLSVEVAALVISIVVLKSKDPYEKDTRTLATIALIISLIMMVVCILYLVFVGRIVTSSFKDIINLIPKLR